MLVCFYNKLSYRKGSKFNKSSFWTKEWLKRGDCSFCSVQSLYKDFKFLDLYNKTFLHSKFSNNLVAVTGTQMTISPMVTDMVDVNKCTPVFAGMRYCTSLDAFSYDSVPYFPFTGDSK